MIVDVTATTSSPARGAETLTAFVIDGLASDAAIGALDGRLAALRLAFSAQAGRRCCAGHQPAFVAVAPDDPTLPDRARVMLAALRPGTAVPGAGLGALEGGIVALPGRSIDVDAPRDLGPGLEQVVVLALADAARGLASAGSEDAMTPRTVAVVRGGGSLPAPWQETGHQARERMPLSVGLPASPRCEPGA